MAKQSNKGGTSRVRFIMLEAEGPEGDLAQIAQAIQNALRPSQIVQQRVITSTSPNGTVPNLIASSADAGSEGDVEDAIADEADAPPQKPREPRQRRTTVPKAFEFDAEAVASWREFASGFDVSTDLDRYLLVAAWLHDHRNNEPVTAGHVYSCYRHMKWPVNIPDFGSQLRAAKFRQFMNSSGRGEYTITQLGLQRVEDLRGS